MAMGVGGVVVVVGAGGEMTRTMASLGEGGFECVVDRRKVRRVGFAVEERRVQDVVGC